MSSSPGLDAVLRVTAAGFASTLICTAVTPLVLVDATGSLSSAGAATTIFSAGTLSGQFLSGPAQTRIPARTMLLVASGLIQIAAVPFLLPDPAVRLLLAATAIRGFGFGILAVVCTRLAFALAERGQEGRAFSRFGLAGAVPSVLAVPGGLFLLERMGSRPVFLLSLLFASLMAASSASRALVVLKEPVPDSSAAPRSGSRRRLPGVSPEILGLFAYCVTYGAVLTFLPLYLTARGTLDAALALLVVSLFRAVTRSTTGPLVTQSPRAYLAASLGAGAVTLLVLTSGLPGLVLIIAAAAYGASFGVAQNASFFGLVRNAEGRAGGPAGVGWNASMDIGVAVGGIGVGSLLAAIGDPALNLVTPLLALLAIPSLLRGAPRPRVRRTGGSVRRTG